MQWFPFLEIMEYNGNDIKNDTPLTSSLLKMFSMLEICLTVGDVNVDEVSLMCSNCKRSTGLKTSGKEFYDKMITPFVMNSMLHHGRMSWIISSKEQIDYDNFTNIKNLGWFDTCPRHNKNIGSNDMELLLKVLLNRLEQTDTISCVL